MLDVVYVSNEEELAASLPGTHKVTVINADYEADLFRDYSNICYCFNETPEHVCNNFYSLKHVFTNSTAEVILESPIYMTLLNKVTTINHSVAFILSLENIKLLRLCECYIDAVNRKVAAAIEETCTVGEEGFLSPHIIGKAKIPGMMVPVWSACFDAETHTLEDVLMNTFDQIFVGKCYSKEGFYHLLALLKDKIPEITGGERLRIYEYCRGSHFRQNVEGPHEMLDTADFINKIKTVAGGLPELLREYEIKVPSGLPQLPTPGQYSVRDAVTEILPMTFEHYRVEMSTHEQAAFENASGALMKLTPKAIANRITKFENNSCSDGMGNIYAFAYRMGNVFGDNWLAVCPEGKEEIIKELCLIPIVDNPGEEQINVNTAPLDLCINVTSNSTIKINISFELLTGKRVKYKVNNNIKRGISLDKSLLRFLVFCAGYKKGYLLLLKGNKEIFLMKDGVDNIPLDRLFKVDNTNSLENYSATIPEMFEPFLPPEFDKNDLLKKDNGQYPKTERLKNGKYQKMTRDNKGKYQKSDNTNVLLSQIELRNSDIFEISPLPEALQNALKGLSGYQNNSEFKNIIDFILANLK